MSGITDKDNAAALPLLLVSKLEDRIGLRLLHRTTRRLRLTSEGEVYFARARSILADIDEVETEVGNRIICAAPSYLERRGVPHKPADLAKHVCFVAVPSSPWPFRTREGTELLKILPRVTSDNGEAAPQLALGGVGIVRLADVTRLVQLLADVHESELVPLSAVYAPGRHRLPKVRVFLDFLVERFGTSPWRQ